MIFGPDCYFLSIGRDTHIIYILLICATARMCRRSAPSLAIHNMANMVAGQTIAQPVEQPIRKPAAAGLWCPVADPMIPSCTESVPRRPNRFG